MFILNNINKTSFHILRIGLAITFLWVGVLIFEQPEAWGGFIQPWAAVLLPIPIEQAMIGTAILDIVIGILFLFDLFIWLAALIGSIHLVIVLVVSGINDITVRDIAILSATLALMAERIPPFFVMLKKQSDEGFQKN